MSGTMIPVQSGPPANPITDAEKVDVRRFCGYPAYGAGNAGFQSWRYFTTYGLLEFRLNNMTVEEVTILRSKLTDLRTLDAAIVAAGGSSLKVSKAAVFTRNPNEMRERTDLYNDRRGDMCSFMGVPPGPDMGNRSGSLRLVV